MVFSFGDTCPCGSNKKKILYECYRFEIFGVQPNHFYFFLPLGFFFPEYFFTIQIIGILWELFEYYIDVNPKLLNKFGGCLDPKMKYSEFAGIIGNGTSEVKEVVVKIIKIITILILLVKFMINGITIILLVLIMINM